MLHGNVRLIARELKLFVVVWWSYFKWFTLNLFLLVNRTTPFLL